MMAQAGSLCAVGRPDSKQSCILLVHFIFYPFERWDADVKEIKHSYDLVQGAESGEKEGRNIRLHEEKSSENCGEKEAQGRNQSGIAEKIFSNWIWKEVISNHSEGSFQMYMVSLHLLLCQ